MKEQIEQVIKYLKVLEIQGCITGSCLLDYFEGQDVDVFAYNEKSFTKLFYALHHNSMFQILDPLEAWKAKNFMEKDEKIFSKFGIITIKFTYNTVIPVNIVLKKNCNNAFSVLSSFDLDIISKAYDMKSKQYLDLTNGSTLTKIANYNKWNPVYNSEEIWEISRVLRQLSRCFKYYKRGYNTDALVIKYKEILKNIENYESLFDSVNFNDKLSSLKINTKILDSICDTWLETHIISESETELLEKTIKLL